MFTVKSNAFFGATTITETEEQKLEAAVSLATSLHHRGHLHDVWVTDESGKVVWHNGRLTAPKLAGVELYKELTEALRVERLRADTAHYYAGERGPAQEYEQAQARTNSLINQILMDD